ncbi:MAG: hypothetical protein JXA89_26520 [Anaerolineae bacterium]|nr:hypothetical protein [Anaerolineae bacterium]
MMSEIREPLALPEGFNPATSMIAKVTENGTFHESRKGAAFAAKLVENGTPQDLELAHKVLETTLNAQERHPDDPHYGNFLWMIEDQVVGDLNAVEFNLEHLIPMMLQHADRLSPEMQQRVQEAIRLGLDEIRRLNVLVAYTNITVLDILNSCLGGELLGDIAVASRGYRKLVEWMALTDMHGIPFEYNSPTYTAVTIRALKRLADHVQHEETRIRARTMAARIGLSVALHLHQGTGRWAGPHSRIYQPSVACDTEAEVEMFQRWLDDGTLPAWLGNALEARPQSFQVKETAFRDRDMGITTYHSHSFALGVSTVEAGGQSDVTMVHFCRPGQSRPGVFYTRYLINDKWLGDFYHATDRTSSRNLIEEGRFFGVQDGARTIGLYAPRQLGAVSSAKAALIWRERDLVDEIWVGDAQIKSLPVDVPAGTTVVVGSGDIWIAVSPLTHTDLGRGAPIRLVEKAGDLVLEIYNYLGPEKTFWEMGWPGAFYKGQPQCGFYLEAAERTDYIAGKAFAETVATGTLTDDAQPPFVYAGDKERVWKVGYERDGKKLGIEIDLMAWRCKRRWTQKGELEWPMLDSPVAREARGGQVTVGKVTLTCGPEAGWVYACPEQKLVVAGYHGLVPEPLTLSTPEGKVEIASMGCGTVVWDNGQVTVEAVEKR